MEPNAISLRDVPRRLSGARIERYSKDAARSLGEKGGGNGGVVYGRRTAAAYFGATTRTTPA